MLDCIVIGAGSEGLVSTQFRLQGPGNKESLAQELLRKLPVSKPTHIVKAGLKGRLIYAFKALIPKFGFVGLKDSQNFSLPLIASRVSSV